MNGSNPVPQPPTEPSGAARAASKPKWMVPAIAAGCAVVLLSAGGGYLYWSHGRLAEASGECEAAYSKAVKGRRELAGYLKSDALKAAITVKDSEVEDAKTVAVLASTVKAVSNTKTDIPGCPADGLKGIRAAAAQLDRTATAYAKTVDEVRGKADAVNASKTDKTVADATKVLNDSRGRVEDDKVRAALENAIKSRDGKAISDAVKAVNDSIKAKSDADAKAGAEKEEQAAENTAQAPGNGSSYTGDTTGGYTGYTGGGYTQSQGGGYTPAPQPAGNGGGYAPAPQPAPQPTPQPPQGNNGGGSGGDDGWDTCFTGDTSGKPGVQVPCN
uniref:hypothetical protein n=1 Tax=Bifidobacterium longum TaxID=216816 RepID=UPI00359CA2B6